MSRPRKAKPPPEKRRWTNNLPYGPAKRPPWDDGEREQKLRSRTQRVAWGKVVSIVGSMLLVAVDSRTQVTHSEIEAAANFARMQSQIASLKEDVNRIQSWFGVPPPRNSGR